MKMVVVTLAAALLLISCTNVGPEDNAYVGCEGFGFGEECYIEDAN